MRTFFGLTFDRSNTAEIDQWRTISLPPFERPVPEENLHVTLVFLGDVSGPQTSELTRSAQMICAPPFKLHFDSLEYWPKQKLACLTPAGVPPELQKLVNDLRGFAQRAGIKVDKRSYLPHVTLARRCEAAPATPILAPDFAVAFDRFSLLASRQSKKGVRYELCQQWMFS